MLDKIEIVKSIDVFLGRVFDALHFNTMSHPGDAKSKYFFHALFVPPQVA